MTKFSKISDGFSGPDVSPAVWATTAKARCRCRGCNSALIKGDEVIRFYGSVGDGGTYNPWKAVEASACNICAISNGWNDPTFLARRRP